MVAQVQQFVQKRFFPLLMLVIGLGFVLLLLELILYRHWQGTQLIALAATVIGAVTAFLGIGARGNFRRVLAGIMIVLMITGVIGVWEHNEERFEGGGDRNAQVQGGGDDDDDGPAQPSGDLPPMPEGGFPGGGGGSEPPPLAPLSLSGFCLLGTIALLGRRDPE